MKPRSQPSSRYSKAPDTPSQVSSPTDPASADAVRSEVAGILSQSGQPAADDRAYLAHVVSRQTGVSQVEAERRVDVAINSIRDSADKARKAASAPAKRGRGR